MTFGQFLAILRARWVVAVSVLAAVLLLALIVSLVLPKQYRAAASVVVDFKPDPVSAVMFGGMATSAFIATQVDIIQSERVAQRVVRNLRLNENPQIRQQWQDDTKGEGSIESWLAATFQRQMDIIPSRESSVITITYRAPDPRFAAALANAFAQAYIDTSLDLRVDPARRYSGFFETRLKESRDALEKSQNRLSEFQKANGIIATDERFDIENARLAELSSQLTALQAISAESASRQMQAQGQQADRLQEVLNHPLLTGLKADISRSEARLQELTTRFGDSHPQVIESRASLAELRQRLEQEIRRVSSGVSVSNAINRQREGEIRASLAAQRAQVLRMKAVRDEGIVLARDVENAQRAYDAIQQRFTQTSLESQTTQSNVNMLTQAVAPLQPASPRLILNLLVALFVGTLLGALVALLLEMRDRRVRNVADIVAALGLPVIGLMPDPKAKPRLGRKQLPSMQQRLFAALPHQS